MPRRFQVICWALFLVLPTIAESQQRLFQADAHGGALEDGRGLGGGQVAVRIFPRLVGYVTGTWVFDVGPDTDLVNYEAGLRYILRSGGLSPYLLGGLSLEHASSPFPSPSGRVTSDDMGFHFGAGMEVGRGWLRPFVEARGFKDGSVAGFFWAGLRVGFGK